MKVLVLKDMGPFICKRWATKSYDGSHSMNVFPQEKLEAIRKEEVQKNKEQNAKIKISHDTESSESEEEKEEGKKKVVLKKKEVSEAHEDIEEDNEKQIKKKVVIKKKVQSEDNNKVKNFKKKTNNKGRKPKGERVEPGKGKKVKLSDAKTNTK